MSESNPLNRPATPEEIEMVGRLLKRTRPAENVVPLAPKTSMEVLALPTLPALQRKPSAAMTTESRRPPTAGLYRLQGNVTFLEEQIDAWNTGAAREEAIAQVSN
jgi:hypothetical protein